MVLKRDNKVKAINFLMNTYGTNTDLAMNMAERHYMVPALLAVENKLQTLDTDSYYSAFGGQNVIEFLFSKCKGIQHLDFADYPYEISNLFYEAISHVIDGQAPVDVFSEFLSRFDYLGGYDYHPREDYYSPVPDEDDVDIEEEEYGSGQSKIINDNLSNSDLSYAYFQQLDRDVSDKFEPHVSLDAGGHLHFDKSGLIFSSDFDTASADMVDRNVKLMNEIVDEGLGHINKDKELVPEQNEELSEAWEVWGFYLKWNKVGAKFDYHYAKVFSIIGLTANVFLNIKGMAALAEKVDENGVLASIITDLLVKLPTSIAAGMVGYFNSILGYLCNFVPIVIGVVSASGPVGIILEIILPILLPSIVDCAVVLYNACRHNKGCEVKFCWIPWFKDKWGLSLKSI